MKADESLVRDIEQELRWDPAVDDQRIAVGVHDRIVTLAGSVRSFTQKIAAQKAVRRVAGCRGLVLELEVPRPSPALHRDEDLASAIVAALKWREELKDCAIQVEVERGCVTLTGGVEWGY